MELCVFCGASDPSRASLTTAIEALADGMLARNWGLVYGGGRVGLMGRVADRVMAGGGRVLGVIPHQLTARELAHQGLTELIEVDSMHARKSIMYDQSDAFVAFPGGFGTLDEVMEILTWKQLGIHNKPIVFANIEGYFDGMRTFFDRATADGLLKAEYLPLFHFADDVPALLAYLEAQPSSGAKAMTWA
jgi:uncharacterized protein (TIGR00730 family)